MSSENPTAQNVKEAEANAQSGSEDKHQHTVVDLSKYIEPHDTDTSLPNFAIEKHQRNTEEHPDRENTNTLPVLVRRVNSEELLPRPFKTTNQLLCASYLSAFCCICLAAVAINRAWEAKMKRNNGVFSSAIKDAKRAFCCVKLAIAVGICLYIIVLLVLYFCTDVMKD